MACDHESSAFPWQPHLKQRNPGAPGLFEVGGEATAGSRGGAVQRTRPALLGAANAVGLEAEQLQDGGHAHECSDGSEVDGRSW